MKSSVLFQFPPDIKSIPNGNVIEYTTAKIVLSIIMSLLSIINNAQRLGYEQCDQKIQSFSKFAISQNFVFYLIFHFIAKTKFWRLRKYTTAFGFNTKPSIAYSPCWAMFTLRSVPPSLRYSFFFFLIFQ